MEKVKVGISCGDMNGVGLETVIKVFCDTRMLEHIVPVIYSHAEIIKQTKRIGGMEEFTYQNASTAEDAVAKKVNLVNHVCRQEGLKHEVASKVANSQSNISQYSRWRYSSMA